MVVDYSKWNDLDSEDSDSDDGSARRAAGGEERARDKRSSSSAKDMRFREQSEILRLQGNAAFERGDLAGAMSAYDAQLTLSQGQRGIEAMETSNAALMNQVTCLLRMEKFAEAEIRCSKVLVSVDATIREAEQSVNDLGAEWETMKARALRFRGFSRLKRGRYGDAATDLRAASSLEDTNSTNVMEVRALLDEAEAGHAMSECKDPEEAGIDLLRKGEYRESAKYFREAANRVLLSKPEDGRQPSGGIIALARALKLQSAAIAWAGDTSTAVLTLREGIKSLDKKATDDGDSRLRRAEKAQARGILMSSLGGLLGGLGNLPEAIATLQQAVNSLEQASTVYRTETPSKNEKHGHSLKRNEALDHILQGALTALGTSLLSLHGFDARRKTVAGREEDGENTVEEGPDRELRLKEAITVLERARGLLRADARGSETGEKIEDSDIRRGVINDKGVTRHSGIKKLAVVLDALSEAYARQEAWEQARAAAEQSMAAWQEMGENGLEGVATMLLTLGHITLQLHGVEGGLAEASAKWEEATECLNRCSSREKAAAVHLKVAGIYSRILMSDRDRYTDLDSKTATHYRQAAELYREIRECGSDSPGRDYTVVAKTHGDAVTTAPETWGELPLPSNLPSEGSSGLDSVRPSRGELALKEAVAWEGYAGAVSADDDEATRGLTKSLELMGLSTVSEQGEAWTLQKVRVLQNLALALARKGDHALAEERLQDAVRSLEELDNVGGPDTCHNDTLTSLYKYLAIVRRANGNMVGASSALDTVAILAGGEDEGKDMVEELNRQLGSRRIHLH